METWISNGAEWDTGRWLNEADDAIQRAKRFAAMIHAPETRSPACRALIQRCASAISKDLIRMMIVLLSAPPDIQDTYDYKDRQLMDALRPVSQIERRLIDCEAAVAAVKRRMIVGFLTIIAVFLLLTQCPPL